MSGFCAPLDASGGPYPAEDTFVNELELGTDKGFNQFNSLPDRRTESGL